MVTGVATLLGHNILSPELILKNMDSKYGFNKNCQHSTHTCPLPIKGTDVLNLIYSGTSNTIDKTLFLQGMLPRLIVLTIDLELTQ